MPSTLSVARFPLPVITVLRTDNRQRVTGNGVDINIGFGYAGCMEEKELLERKALAYFLRLYNRKFNRKFQLLVKRERPDFEIKDKVSGDVLGVEVSHIFHDKKEAMMFLGRDASYFHGIISGEDHVKVLMQILKDKAIKIKSYDCDAPIILVIRDYSKIFDVETIFDPRLGLKVPQSDYLEVWCLGRSRPVSKWDLLVRLK